MLRILIAVLCLVCSGCAGGMRLAGAPAPAPERDAWVAEDKFKHFFASFAVSSIAASGARAAGLDARESVRVGAGVGVGLGIAKEARDALGRSGSPSLRDLVWDLGGVGASAALMSQVR